MMTVNKTAFLFDVDGTLTPSRQSMNSQFRIWFCEFMSENDVYLVTGSDYEKTVEQLGVTITENVKAVYNCSGNDVWINGKNVYTSDWKLPAEPHEFLNECLQRSDFPLRTGNHFEHRPGTVNFSIVGRNATHGERKLYVKYDAETNERKLIVNAFNDLFGDTIEATAGGETGLDIYPRGKDKSQIIQSFSEYDSVIFIGDRCEPGGNDYTLARAVSELSDNKNSLAYGRGKFYNVDGWEDTWEILQNNLQPIEI